MATLMFSWFLDLLLVLLLPPFFLLLTILMLDPSSYIGPHQTSYQYS